MDDESYFCLNGAECSGNKGFYSANISHCPVNIRRRGKEKLPQKVFVWLTIDENGKISKPFFMKEGYMSGEIYLKQCVVKRLMPSIKSNNNAIFWPDCASSHYTKSRKM